MEAVPPKVRIGLARSAPASSDGAKPRNSRTITASCAVCAAAPETAADVLWFGFGARLGETARVRDNQPYSILEDPIGRTRSTALDS